MAPVRPEFFYHPAVGVISPASLGLFAFKSGPLTVPAPLANTAAPKPLLRANVQTVTEQPAILHTSPIALNTQAMPQAAEAAPSTDPEKESDMKKMKSDPLGMEVCIVTGEQLPIAEMIRFVADPQNEIMADLSEKLPGQGYWVTADKDILKKAIWRNSFTTAARTPVTVPKNIVQMIQIGLLKQSLETLSLAKKAGLVTQGFAKVEDVLKENKAKLYIVASDAKENGREKLEKLTGSMPVLDIWTSSQLSAALGVDNAIHVVLTEGGLTDKLTTIATKLRRFN